MTAASGRSARLELYWVPLGAGTSVGSHVVRLSGGIYERLTAAIQRRSPRPLFHSALIAHTAEGPYVVEMTPVPRHGLAEERGVVGGGPVGSRLLGRSRVFRYEIRRWRDGAIADLDYAIDSPVVISTDTGEVEQVLDVLPDLPSAVWGRDHAHAGDMWNSNSVVSWALQRAGLAGRAGTPPRGGRAPGWDAGIELAQRHATTARVGTPHGGSTSSCSPPTVRARQRSSRSFSSSR
jgi:hypothetical protein